MLREQAIFFEVMEDLDLQGYLEPLFFAYHDFVSEFDFAVATDMEVHARAMECLERHAQNGSDRSYYDVRWDVLETLDLASAQWKYRDRRIGSQSPDRVGT